MAIDPPYRLDPLQNVVDVKWEEGGDPCAGDPGSPACWGFSPSLFIEPCVTPYLAWPTCNPRPLGTPQCTTDTAEAAGCFPQCAFWYVDGGGTIICFQYSWLSGQDCGFSPGPCDFPPTSPPDDWIGFDFSPNSEE